MTRRLATVVVDGARYGVDVGLVQEALRPHPRTPVPLAPAGLAGLLNLRGQVVLAVDARPRLGLPPLAPDASPMMLVVEIDDDVLALLVDEIGDVVDVDEADFEPPPDTLDPVLRDVVRGAYKRPEGLLLDLDVRAAVETPAALSHVPA